VQENFCLVFSIASSVTKILANKIVSLYSIFFSKIVYLYRFKRYIFEYRCQPLRKIEKKNQSIEVKEAVKIEHEQFVFP
jgi:hypothetical protein